MNDPAADYWDSRYTVGVEHHARQNEQLARDFSRSAFLHPHFKAVLRERLVVEVGCGTGDLCNILTNIHYCAMEGSDLSGLAVEIAKIRFPHLLFRQHDILKDPPFGRFEVAVASNVLEHFQDPHPVVMKMFDLAPTLVIIGPYNQPLTDKYDTEGGAGHVITLNQRMLSPYHIKAWMLFKSDGWSCETSKFQFAAVLEQR